MDPLTTVGTGLSLVGSISNLLGGASARRRAEEARQQAVLRLMQALAQEESDQQSSNSRNVASYSGNLASALDAQGRALGDATASAGVWNSSATAGALANQAAENSSNITRYATDLAERLASLRSQNRQRIAGYQLGQADQDLSYARDADQGFLANVGNVLRTLPMFVHPPKLKSVDPIQSAVQSKQTETAQLMGTPDGRSFGMFTPGMQGAKVKMPGIVKSNFITRPFFIPGAG